MAFYKDMNKHESKDAASQRGGWDDEGARYNDRGRSGHASAKPAFGARSARPVGAKSAYGAKPAYGNRPAMGDKRPYGAKPAYGDRPAMGDKRPYGAKPAYGDRPAMGDKRPYGAKPAYGDRPAMGDKRPYGAKRSFGDRPAMGDKRPYGAKPAFGPRSYGDAAPAGERRSSYQQRFEHSARRPEGQITERRSYGVKPSFAPRPATPRSFDRSYGRPVARPAEGTAPSYKKYEYAAPTPIVPVIPVSPAIPVEEDMAAENILSGRNPIREAIKTGRDIEKLMVARGDLSGSAREIISMAKEAHIPVQEVERVRLDEITKNHQGMIAFASAYQYSTVEDMLSVAKEKGEEPFLVLLDGVTDPHNLGAIIRTAECVGAHGVIVPERRSVGLTPAAVKASAGAVEYVKVARVVNLNRTIEELKEKGVWTYGATMDGTPVSQVNFKGPVALIIGAEGEGVSRLTCEKCDQLVSLPMKGKIDSLNASVAAGVLMYAVLGNRQ